MLGFLEVAAVENIAAPPSDGSEFIHGKSWLVGFTTYRAIDPLVLAATLAWRSNLSRPESAPASGSAAQTRNPGDLLLINPSVSFAVNNEVTLTTGLQWRWQGGDQLDGQSIDIRTTNTSLTLGLGHAWSQRLTLNLNSRANISGNDGAEVQFTAMYKLGDLPKRQREKPKEVKTEGE